MSRTRIIYQNEAVYVGPSPATGYHFIGTSGAALGVLNDDYDNEVGHNLNLLQYIPRVQSFTYDADIPYTNIRSLGHRSSIYRAQTNEPTVNVSFTYLQMGIINEERFGLNVNFAKTGGASEGVTLYPNNTGHYLFSGFEARDLITHNENTLGIPYNFTDQRNIFLATETIGNDLNTETYEAVHPNYETINVLGIGNCHLTSYETNASVGAFPTCTVSFVGQNIETYSSGRWLVNPALKSDRTRATTHFNIPTSYIGEEQLSVLRPGDISIDLSAQPKHANITAIEGTGIGAASPNIDNIYSLGVNVPDLKIQSYTISYNLNRVPLQDLQKRISLDKPFNHPITVNLNFNAIIGDPISGSLLEQIDENFDYNVTVKLNNPGTSVPAVRYDFVRAKLTNYSSQGAIESNKSFDFTFDVELDPDNYTQGFYMSGYHNVKFPADGEVSDVFLLPYGEYVSTP